MPNMEAEHDGRSAVIAGHALGGGGHAGHAGKFAACALEAGPYVVGRGLCGPVLESGVGKLVDAGRGLGIGRVAALAALPGGVDAHVDGRLGAGALHPYDVDAGHEAVALNVAAVLVEADAGLDDAAGQRHVHRLVVGEAVVLAVGHEADAAQGDVAHGDALHLEVVEQEVDGAFRLAGGQFHVGLHERLGVGAHGRHEGEIEVARVGAGHVGRVLCGGRRAQGRERQDGE